MILNARQSLLNRAIHQQMADIDVFFLNLNIHRSNLVSDSLNEIAKKQNDLKKKLKVTFIGEPGLDMGGLTKEWFLLLIKQIFHEDYANGSRSLQLNVRILDLHFPTLCFKKLLSPPVVPVDVDRCNDVAVGLKELLSYEGNVEEDFCMNF
ncbi:unnamed protein product, partial [Oppiella nova]